MVILTTYGRRPPAHGVTSSVSLSASSPRTSLTWRGTGTDVLDGHEPTAARAVGGGEGERLPRVGREERTPER